MSDGTNSLNVSMALVAPDLGFAMVVAANQGGKEATDAMATLAATQSRWLTNAEAGKACY